MVLKAKLFLAYLLVMILSVCTSSSRELIQIQTLTRHGERSPCFTYPADPHKNAWIKGLGQLTNKGVAQLKEVGSFLRVYYKDLLPIDFHKKKIYIRSSDTDRTISSAIAAMSTLFENQIVPVHTVPKSYDFLLKMTSICPYHKKLLSNEFKHKKYQAKISEYSEFFKELEEGTDLDNVDIHMAFRICDAITVWNQLNMTLPGWVNAASVTKCIELGHMKFIISYSNNLLTKFRGGPLVHNMVDSMIKRAKSFLEDKSGMKMIGFFAHDSTMSAFFGHLGSFNHLKPPLASTAILELYYEPDQIVVDNNPLSQFVVRLLFRNESQSEPYVLTFGLCAGETDCRLDLLVQSLEPYAIKDLPRECGLTSIIDYWFASSDKNKINHESLVINDGELKSVIPKQKYESDLLVNILFPLLLVEILVFFIFYKFFKK